MKSYQDALEIIKHNFQPNKSVLTVVLENSCWNVLAENVFADVNLPPFDNSAMDGYAIKLNPDIRRWKLIGELTAGNYHEFLIDDHSTVSIMTGAKIPDGADTVVPVEDVFIEDGFVNLREGVSVKICQDIRNSGNDLAYNSLAMKINTRIVPKHIPILAACGKREVNIFAPLKIGVLSTGDELVDINNVPINDQIRATNVYSMMSLIKSVGMTGVNLGYIKDSSEEIEKNVISALNSDIDVLVTTGGVSVGTHDYLKKVLEDMGANIYFWRVNIKPGKPFLFASINIDGKVKYIFGLPGNPLSAYVDFNILVKPAIYKLYNIETDKYLRAYLKEEMHKHDSKLHFVLGVAEFDKINCHYTVSESGNQSSGNMYSMSIANCLIMFNEDKKYLSEGEVVGCIWI